MTDYNESKGISPLDYNPREIVWRSQNDWNDWYIQSKSKATNLDLWKYFQDDVVDGDTSITEREPQRPIEPTPPEAPGFEAEERLWIYYNRKNSTYKDAFMRWGAQLREYEKYEGMRRAWKSYIDRTIPTEYVALLNKQPNTLIAWWTFLKARFAPQADYANKLLQDEHVRLMQGPKNQDIERFFIRWDSHNIKIRESGHLLQGSMKNDFCRMFEEKVDLTAGRNAGDLDTFEKALTYVRNFIQRAPGNFKYGKQYSSNATREETTTETKRTPPKDNTNKGNETQRGQKRFRGCSNITGKPKHKECPNLRSCPTVNHKIRPNENDMTQEERRYLDNYKQYLRDHNSFWRDQVERWQDPLAIKMRQNRLDHPQTRRRVGETDDRSVNSTRVLVRSNATRIAVFEDELLLDGGSNAHIINDPEIGQFNPKVIPEDVTIKTGNTQLTVVVRGDLTVTIIGIQGEEIDLDLKDVLYVPGYHTNIVSDPQMRTRGLYLDGKSDIWYDQYD